MMGFGHGPDLPWVPRLDRERFDVAWRLSVGSYTLSTAQLWREEEHAWQARTTEDLSAHLERTSTSTVAVVVMLTGLPRVGGRRRALTALRHVLENLSTSATNSLGRDVTAFGVLISSHRERVTVGKRLNELASSAIHSGHLVCVHARDLRNTSLRQIFDEELL